MKFFNMKYGWRTQQAATSFAQNSGRNACGGAGGRFTVTGGFVLWCHNAA
jgi:hypothetical protein